MRGATEGINLVAHSAFENRDSPYSLRPGDRIMLSVLEHHSNIVPWQLAAERAGAKIDVVPLTADGRTDLVLGNLGRNSYIRASAEEPAPAR